MARYNLVFDEIILKQLKDLSKNKGLKEIISKILDKIEELGPNAGNLLDSKLHIYEIKRKSPPIRLYFKHNLTTEEIYIFKYEMKNFNKKKKRNNSKAKKKIRILSLFLYTFSLIYFAQIVIISCKSLYC